MTRVPPKYSKFIRVAPGKPYRFKIRWEHIAAKFDEAFSVELCLQSELGRSFWRLRTGLLGVVSAELRRLSSQVFKEGKR